MARTYNDIYYNDDENSTAEILDDMKKLAESVDQQIGSIKSFNNDTSQFIEQVTPLMNTLSEQVIDMHQLADTMFTELEQVKEENKQLRQDLNGLPKGQASGESIDLNDSAEMRCELKISGNSKQETRSGKNLIRNENINVGDDCYWSSYSTFDKETYTMTRKTTNTTESFITYRIGNGIIKNNTQYTISFEAKKNDYVKSFEVLFIGYNASGIRSKTIDLTKEFQKYTYTFTTDATADYKSLSQIRFDNNGSTESGKEAILTIKNVMLVEGTDTDFEQYGASPSPDYPSEVESCGDNGSINEVICNKNLFDKESVLTGTAIQRNTGNILTTSAYSTYSTSDYCKVKSSTTYFLGIAYSSTNFGVVYYDKDKNHISGEKLNNYFTTPSNCEYVRFTWITADYNISTIQLEEGSTATAYEEHQSQSYTIPTQQPMRAIGDIRDTFIKKNNKWYEHHPIVRIESYNGETITSEYISNTGELSTGATVDYISDTPVDIECTEEQSTILDQIENEAKTYKNVTHIYSTDEISPVIDVTYKKDIETLFANTLVEGV